MSEVTGPIAGFDVEQLVFPCCFVGTMESSARWAFSVTQAHWCAGHAVFPNLHPIEAQAWAKSWLYGIPQRLPGATIEIPGALLTHDFSAIDMFRPECIWLFGEGSAGTLAQFAAQDDDGRFLDVILSCGEYWCVSLEKIEAWLKTLAPIKELPHQGGEA